MTAVPQALVAEPSRLTYLPQLVLFGVAVFGAIAASLQPGGEDTGGARLFFAIPGVLLALLSVYSFVVQWRAFHVVRPMLFRLELLLLAGAVVLPVAAIIIGDLNGSATFNNASELSPGLIAFVAGLCAVPAMVLVASVNALYIVTRFHLAVKILGILGYGAAWVVVTIVTYLAYAIMYSAHDPSTE